jgi:hypothetical protein
VMSGSMENSFAEVEKKAANVLLQWGFGWCWAWPLAVYVTQRWVSLYVTFIFTDILRLSTYTTFAMFCFAVQVFVGSDYTV